MRLPCTVLLALPCAPLALAGCIESSKDRYIADYQPLNDRSGKVNDRLVETLNTPSSPGKLAARADAAVGRARPAWAARSPTSTRPRTCARSRRRSAGP